ARNLRSPGTVMDESTIVVTCVPVTVKCHGDFGCVAYLKRTRALPPPELNSKRLLSDSGRSLIIIGQLRITSCANAAPNSKCLSLNRPGKLDGFIFRPGSVAVSLSQSVYPCTHI